MVNNEKLLRTEEIFDEYERRFASARAGKTLRNPAEAADRKEIQRAAAELLAFDKIPQPEVTVLDEKEMIYEGVCVRHMLYKTWEKCYGEALLLVPEGAGKAPLIVICTGHGKRGILSESYQKMAFGLVKRGVYVLIADNVGQGLREEMGHWDVIAPFYCGITLQGMIVAETRAWIRYMKKQPYVDVDQIGACGNSGGGTLTTFLAALEPSLAAIASSGYPSEFSYLLQKERPHCACNILRGFAGKLDMWEIFGTYAPKPLFLSTGVNDCLIPVELFERTSRKTAMVYAKADAADKFEYKITNTLHAWEDEDRDEITAFFARTFDLDEKGGREDYIMPIESGVFDMPEDSMTTDEVAQQITGVKMADGTKLSDVFVPSFKGKRIAEDEIISDLGRGSLMRVFAQFEASL